MFRGYKVEIPEPVLAAAWADYQRECSWFGVEPIARGEASGGPMPPGYVFADGRVLPAWFASATGVARGAAAACTAVGPRALADSSRVATYVRGGDTAVLYDDGLIKSYIGGELTALRAEPVKADEFQRAAVRCRTPAELTKARAAAVATLEEASKPGVVVNPLGVELYVNVFGFFTCDGCGAAATCPFAFDQYNTDGDCLAEK